MRLSVRGTAIGVASLLAVTGMVLTVNSHMEEQSHVAAAQQLASQSPTVTNLPSMTPTPTPSITPTPSATASTPPQPAIVYPLKGFTWLAAGVNVSVVAMDRATWQDQAAKDGVDPQTDANGFDPVAHWLQGTGPDGDGQIFDQQRQSIILAAHTCYGTDSNLCNDATFPFNRLSYGGWAVGQQASITDGADHVFDMTLVRREVVSKSGFAIDNDPCEVQVFTCNKQDPHNQATLVTFKRTQCKA